MAQPDTPRLYGTDARMLTRLMPSPRTRMLLRRVGISVLALALIGLCALAGVIASRDYGAIERDIVARLEREAGATIELKSRRQVLWPRPKIVYEAVSFERKAQDFILKAPQAVLTFNLLDILDGSIDSPSITLIDPVIDVVNGRFDAHLRSPRAMTDMVDRIAGMLDDRAGLNRFFLAIQNASVTFRNAWPTGEAQSLTGVDARLRFSAGKGRVDLYARHNSTIRPLEFSASIPTRKSLGQNKAHAAAINLSGYESRLAFVGTIRRDPDIALIGKLDTTVGAALERMMLVAVPERREPRPETTTLSATMILDPRGVGLESLKITRTAKQLAGIAALREINGRWGVSATLAGDLVDGTAVHAALLSLRASDGAWSTKPLVINPIAGLDLDVRLSTREFKLGNLLLTNVALSVLTRPGRAEVAVVDSRFGAGLIKARVSLADTPNNAQEIRLQASADRVDIGRFFDRAFGFNRLSGDGNLVIQAEGRGTGIAALVASLSGSGALEMRTGEIVGVDLARLLARASDSRPETALILALAGKTPFEAIRANFAIKDGKIEPVGSSFTSARVTAMLEGGIDLTAQRHQLAIVLKRRIDEPGQPGEFYAFRIDGPLFQPSLKPDLRLLLNRS